MNRKIEKEAIQKAKWTKPIITRILLDPSQAVLAPCVVARGPGSWPAVWMYRWARGWSCAYFYSGYIGAEGTSCNYEVKGDRTESATVNAGYSSTRPECYSDPPS